MKTKRTFAERFVGAMRASNRIILLAGAVFTFWWALKAIDIVRMQYTDGGKHIDDHVILGLGILSILGLLWLATREFFSAAERGKEKALQESLKEPVYVEEVFLVGVTMSSTHGASREELELEMLRMLAQPGVSPNVPGMMLEDWWVAEDDRHDRSDCDSAIFVPKGMQHHVATLLRARGFGQWSNR